MLQKFSVLNLIGVSDIIPERSRAKAEQYGLRQMTNQEIFDCPEIEIVVNLTYPMAHYEVTKAALLRGKHVWSEKMMAVTLEEADELAKLATQKGLRLAVAPDTFLGGGLQTCRKIIDAGLIGDPAMAHAFVARGALVVTPLEENKRMTLSPGGGIPFDMGGYYLTALVNMLGPIRRVGGFAQLRKRTFLNVKSPRFGEEIQLETPTNLAGTLEFESGVLANVAMEAESFMETPRLEVYGNEGTLICPDPNTFGGPVKIIRRNHKSLEPYEFPLTHGFFEGCNRGLGVAEIHR
jgi:predicted dehydrogenase